MSHSVVKHALKTAFIMVVFSLVGTAMLATTYCSTREPIAESERQAKLKLIDQVLPKTMYNNQLLKDTIKIKADGMLGNRDETLAYRARLNDKLVAVVLEAVAREGYSGDIKLLIAILANGEVAGVRVLTHKETPGLGDYIDIDRSDWIKNSFDRQSLAKTPEDGWKVKKDGGRFDYMAGATITPRAVVKTVHQALKYFSQHQNELLNAATVTEDSINEQ